jgi:hypothetical protein
MGVLLSASRLLVWRHHVDACSLRILFAGNADRHLKKAIGVPETAGSEGSLELTGSMRDNTISGLPWGRQSMPKLSKCWHSAYQVGRTEATTSP